MPAGPGRAVPILGQDLLRHAAAIVPDGEDQVLLRAVGADADLAAGAVPEAVQNGVFHQRLEHQLRHRHVPQRLVHLHRQGERAGKADVLDLHVPLHKAQLLPQRDQLIGGDAAAQDVGKVGGDGGDLRGLMDLAHPLDGVQRVVQEVGVELGLHHADLSLVQLPLLAQGVLQILPQALGHPVEPTGELAHLVDAAVVQLDVQVALLHLAHGAVEGADRLKELAAEAHGRQHAQPQAQQQGKPRHQIHQFGGALGHGLGLLEHQTEAGARLLPDEVIISAVAVGEGLSGQKLAAQAGGQRLGGEVGRGVHLIPEGVQQQKAAGGGVLPVEKRGELGGGDVRHHVSQRNAAPPDGAGRLNAGGAFGRCAAVDHAAVRRRGQQPPAGGEGAGGGLAGGGVELAAVRAVNGETGPAEDRRGRAVQNGVDALLVQLGAVQRRRHRRLGAELFHDGLAVGQQPAQLAGHGVKLRLGGVRRAAGQRKAEDVEHQQRADQQGQDADGQKAGEQLLAEGGVFHDGASSRRSSGQRAEKASFSSAAQRTG